MFYEKKVIEKFDENVNLLGFNNGVIDLKSYEFRHDITFSWAFSMFMYAFIIFLKQIFNNSDYPIF